VLALIGAVLLLSVSIILVNRVLPDWAYTGVNLLTAVLLLALARWARLGDTELGLDGRHLRRALLFGLVGLAAVAVVFAVAVAFPSLRRAFDDGRFGQPGVGGLLWTALVRIPLGTVLLEEIAFRGVLPALLGADERWRWGPVLGASALFGLWHVLPSFALQQNAAVEATMGRLPVVALPVAAVVASAAAGVVLYWWRHAGRGLLASGLVHLATNSGGLLVAWWLLSRR
jgi:membrane protease YdiL (CAAX protease family)